jgi:hypothetical protein
MQKSSAVHAEAEVPASFSSIKTDESAAVSTALIPAETAAVLESASPQDVPSQAATAGEGGTPTHEIEIPVSSNAHQEMFANASVPADEAPQAKNTETIDARAEVEESHGEAFAAAASAGSVIVESVSVESIPHSDSGFSSTNVESANTAASPEKSNGQADRQRETELAAAWQNWKQIRETIVGTSDTQTASAPVSPTMDSAPSISSESAAPSGFKDLRSEPKATVQSAAKEALAEPVADDSAIASIVDNMLADLKPKLMEEIARKMAKEKEKK